MKIKEIVNLKRYNIFEYLDELLHTQVYFYRLKWIEILNSLSFDVLYLIRKKIVRKIGWTFKKVKHSHKSHREPLVDDIICFSFISRRTCHTCCCQDAVWSSRCGVYTCRLFHTTPEICARRNDANVMNYYYYNARAYKDK